MNRRFFLGGLIAAPIVAGSPLARFIMPARRSVFVTPKLIALEAAGLFPVSMMPFEFFENRIVGYRLEDTVDIRPIHSDAVRRMRWKQVDADLSED